MRSKIKIVLLVAAAGILVGGPAWAVTSSSTVVTEQATPTAWPTAWQSSWPSARPSGVPGDWWKNCGPRRADKSPESTNVTPSQGPKPWWKRWTL